MGYAKPITITMTDMECGNCGIFYAVPESWRAERQKNGTGWCCPNGCERVYRKSDIKKAEEKLAEEKKRHAATLARLNMATLEVQKHKKRVSAGVCPCCNRTFKQLARHMKCKHPDYSKESGTKLIGRK